MNRGVVVSVLLYAVLAILVIPVFPHFPSPNEYSRWALDAAIVDFHTIEVTPVLRSTGIPITDLAEVDGRLFSNKPPGAALMVLPVYALVRAVAGPPSIATMRMTLTVIRLAGATVPVILLALWVASVARRSGCSESRTNAAVTAMLFATPLFCYGLLFFAHALSAVSLFGAWALLFATDRRPSADYAAGSLIGLAVLCENPNAVPSVALIVCAMGALRIRGLIRVIACGLPFAAILGVYNYVAFGSPFAVAYLYDRDAHIRTTFRTGAFGLGVPSMAYFLDMLLDSSKGLLVLSPVVIIAIAGIMRARRALSRPAFVALLVAPLLLIVAIAGYPYWFGGRSIGPRFIVPVLPFIALLTAFAEQTLVEAVLLGASSATIAVMSLVFPFVPTIYAVPWVSFSWPLLRHGCVAPNLFHFIWAPLAVVAPFAIVTAAIVMAVPLRHVTLLGVGAVLWFAIGFIAEARHASPPYLRILVEAVNFERRDAIERALPAGHPAIPILQKQAEALRRLPPPSWPF
ncbi:MAG TPA: hypothetical protein VGK31_04960 [Thermoanaerobaculia bacterium]